ncbi:MAG: hypothetical protein RL161_590 [Bacteroidota bacterium]|jgi:hypothetical protein
MGFYIRMLRETEVHIKNLLLFLEDAYNLREMEGYENTIEKTALP